MLNLNTESFVVEREQRFRTDFTIMFSECEYNTGSICKSCYHANAKQVKEVLKNIFQKILKPTNDLKQLLLTNCLNTKKFSISSTVITASLLAKSIVLSEFGRCHHKLSNYASLFLRNSYFLD